LLEFQNSAFKLAEIKTDLAVGWAFLDQSLHKIIAGTLTAEEGAMAKLWTTERRAASSTSACNCSAATATCANTRFRACMSMRVSGASMPALLRS